MSQIIPVVTLKNVEERTAVLSALKKSGILCAEICFRTPFPEISIWPEGARWRPCAKATVPEGYRGEECLNTMRNSIRSLRAWVLFR